MSHSRRHKTAIALTVALLAAAFLAGCGDGPEKTVDAPGKPASTGQTGTFEGEYYGEEQPSGESGGAGSEPQRAGVVIELENGKFAANTPSTIHVEPGFEIEIDFEARDDKPYSLNISSPSGPSSVQVPAGGGEAYIGPKLAEGESVEASYAGRTIKIVAGGAEPGP